MTHQREAAVLETAGLPVSWSWSEGPSTVLAGLAYVWLARRAR